MDIELTVEERDYLEGLLRETLGTIKEEVEHPDTPTLRRPGNAEEELVRKLIVKLRGVPPQVG